MPDICYPYLPANLQRLFDRKRTEWSQNLPEPPQFGEFEAMGEAEDEDEEDMEGDESDPSLVTRGM